MTHFRELDDNARGEILEMLDPDWRDRFLEVDRAWNHYAEWGKEELADAIAEYMEEQ